MSIRLYPLQDVKAFHEKFGLLVSDRPVHLTKRKLKERVEFLLEELEEFAEGCGLGIAEHESGEGLAVYERPDPTTGTGHCPQDMAAQADALVDLVYVALGTAVMLGLPWNALWDDVHRANMAKERGVTHRGHAVDVTKPAGWQPPMTHLILQEAGYNQAIQSKEQHHVDDQP